MERESLGNVHLERKRCALAKKFFEVEQKCRENSKTNLAPLLYDRRKVQPGLPKAKIILRK